MAESADVFDVLICGAGPAGSTCALAMGKSGLRVALLDKSSFPRDKVCGDALAAYVPKVLESIDPSYAEAFRQFSERERVNTVRIVAPNEKHVDVPFSIEGCISTRLAFDDFLFQLAKKLPQVTVFENTTVTDVAVLPYGAWVSTGSGNRLHAKMIIGCDGANGVVARKLTKTKVDLNHHSGAVRGYYENVQGIPPGTFEIHLLKEVLPGYLWIFPLPGNKANVGLGQLSQSVSDKKVNLREVLKRVVAESPTLKNRFKDATLLGDIRGYGLPLGSRKVTMSGERFMLCGDAASLIDPLTGEGIGQAMVSGRYAGWQAAKCIAENKFSAACMKEYDDLVYAKFWKTHFSHYLAQKVIGDRPWVVNASIGLALRSSVLEKVLKKLFW